MRDTEKRAVSREEDHITSRTEILPFAVQGQNCLASLNLPESPSPVALLIVSGGNEVRSGRNGEMARLAHDIAVQGHAVMRYDRRGTGDSEGENRGWQSSREDIAAAAHALRARLPHIRHIVAMGNCDAATALILFGANAGLSAIIASNIWTLGDPDALQNAYARNDMATEEQQPMHPMPPQLLRKRYMARLFSPNRLRASLGKGTNWRNMLTGFWYAATSPLPGTPTTKALAKAMENIAIDCHLLIADKDRTGASFAHHWKSRPFGNARRNDHITLIMRDSHAHNLCLAADRQWLIDQITALMKRHQ